MKKMSISKYIRTIEDFPKPGVKFKDITPLLNNSRAVQETLHLLMSRLKGIKIDKVVGVESRGFFFGMLLAQEFKAGFVPARKPNKLPFETISAFYELEYGLDSLEIHSDAIQKGENVLIHDDILATGGTARAVCELVERLGGAIVQCNFVLELSFLKGREKIKDYTIYAPLVY